MGFMERKWNVKMNDYEKDLIDKQRNYVVCKSNSLILNSRYQYSIAQQKMIAYICARIRPMEEQGYQLEYDFNIADYLRLMGVESTGDAYHDIKMTLKSLRDKSYWLTLPDGSETTVSWVDKVTTNRRSGLAKYKIDADLAPYLFALQTHYLSYGLINILNFKSKYGIRLYEILKAQYDMLRSQQGKKRYETPVLEWVISLGELKHRLMAEDYKRYPDFRIKVLETAQRDINVLSDMQFEFEPICKGRKTVQVRFLIRCKELSERFESFAVNEQCF